MSGAISMLLSDVDTVSWSHPTRRGDAGSTTRSLVPIPRDAVPAPRRADEAELAEAAAVFASLRSRLFGIAYQMLGGAADAEDVVQDVWIRWQGTDRARVRDRVAFLVTITTRVSLNAATSARARREVTVGAPPAESDAAFADPLAGAERSEALELAVKLLIERLSPTERAVFVLREAFDYPFREIAEALELSEPNARQVARRARRRLAGQRRSPAERAERDDLLGAFLHAAHAGDMAGLVHVLTGARSSRAILRAVDAGRPVLAPSS